MDIQIRRVKKFYEDNQVLDIDELSIENGKITGITGPERLR